jgi:digeranylgeranylglycerophospholipid reductase
MMTYSTEEFDVCIIGASIAGNYLSYLLSNVALKIAIIEEHEDIGLPLQCAGIISQKISKLINLPDKVIKNRVQIAKLVSPTGISIELSGNETPFIIDRVLLDKHFFTLAKTNDNLRFYLGERVKSLSINKKALNHSITITTSRRILKAKLLVGCDGPISFVGNFLNIRNKLLYATQIRIKANFSENKAVLIFNPRWKELFGWIVPEGNRIFRIGIACLSQIRENFMILLENLNINYHDKIDQQGGLIPYGMMNNCAFDNIILLGDAAGQVKATTGGGIVMLITAAKIASKCIKKAFTAKDFSKKFLKNHYELPCKKSIGRELRIHFIIRKILELFDKNDFDSFFTLVKEYHIEKIISIYGDMDFPRKLVIQMLKNPIIIKFLLKFIIRKPILLAKLLFISSDF